MHRVTSCLGDVAGGTVGVDKIIGSGCEVEVVGTVFPQRRLQHELRKGCVSLSYFAEAKHTCKLCVVLWWIWRGRGLGVLALLGFQRPDAKWSRGRVFFFLIVLRIAVIFRPLLGEELFVDLVPVRVFDVLQRRRCSVNFLGGQVSFCHLVHCVLGWIPLATSAGSNTCCSVSRF